MRANGWLSAATFVPAVVIELMEDPVYIIIRFPIHLLVDCRNSLQKFATVHRGYNGKVSGVTYRIQKIEGDWPESKGVVMLPFSTRREAQLWKDSIPEVKQWDWMEMADIILTPVRCMPPETFRLVQMIEIRVVCCEEFLNWSNEISCLLHEYPNVCRPFVVATEEIYKFRGLWNPSYLLINFWTDAENFQEVFCSDRYRSLNCRLCAFGEIISCVFELCRLVEEPCPYFPPRNPTTPWYHF